MPDTQTSIEIEKFLKGSQDHLRALNLSAVESAKAILAWAKENFKDQLILSSALGAEDQILAYFGKDLDIPIFTLDTGRLFPESYDLIARTERNLKVKIKIYSPSQEAVENLVNKKGINLFYDSVENRKECCAVRKLEPLRRALAGQKAWICGLRQSQSDARLQVQPIEWDGLNSLYKLNPLWNWSDDLMWSFVKENKIPYNPLHDKGFLSIGCAPCTRAIAKGDHPRSGRWWWEDENKKECGLHNRNA
jgi:phosphoadenosine phosphosulfate reductase